MVGLRQAAHVHPWVAAFRIVDAEVLARVPAAESVLTHPGQHLVPHQIVALADDHVLAAATVHPRKLMAVSLSLLQLDLPLHQALEIAHLVCPGLCRVQTARAQHLRQVRTAGLSHRDELGRLVYVLQRAMATRVLRLLPALPLLPAMDAHPACLFHAQPVMAMRLTRAPALHPEARDRLCRADQA
jgi:hypothetical protein